MKKVICYVDASDKNHGRTEAFYKLCTLFMLLNVWNRTVLIDEKTGNVCREWYINRTTRKAGAWEWIFV